LVIQAWGNNLAATAIIAGALAWHIRHPSVAAGSQRPLEVKAETTHETTATRND
jgi:hypothetical protein